MKKQETHYKGVRIKHRLECLELVFQIIEKHQPEMFIELGTGWGGVPLAINDRFPKINIYSFDRHNHGRNIRNRFSKKVHLFRADILGGEHKKLLELLEDKRRKILYCDNGNKKYELLTFSQYMKPGDLIGVHDWLSRPPTMMRSEEYQRERLANGNKLENTCIVETDVGMVFCMMEEQGFEKYEWEMFEIYPQVMFGDQFLVTDPRASSRFWIRK